MTHAHGTRLDGIVSLHDLRDRCVVDDEEDGGCWHLRTASGKALPHGQRHSVWMHGLGHVTATRAAWLLKNPGRELRNGWVAFRTCSSYDCVRHISAASRANWAKHLVASGKTKTPAKVASARAAAQLLPQRKLTPELRQWLLESEQSGCEVAHALGIAQSRANCIRAEHRKAQATRPAASVFEFAMRAAA
jgi:hypothetical protein